MLTPHDLVTRVASDFKEQQQQQYKQHGDRNRREREEEGRREETKPEREGREEEQGSSSPPRQHHHARYTRVKAGLVTPGDPVHAVWVSKPTTLPKVDLDQEYLLVFNNLPV